MARLLVVEDSPSQARLIRALLETAGHQVSEAVDGLEALAAMEAEPPQLVLTDLQMPNMGGLQLVEALRRRHPTIPVVLMTAFGSQDIAVQALKQGAASYVPKKRLSQNLLPTVHNLLAIAGSNDSDSPLPGLAHCEATFLLEHDPAAIPGVTGYIHNMLLQVQPWSENTLMRLGIAVHEAVVNAIYHGNLEISSDHREGDAPDFDVLAERRRQLMPYANRRVTISARVSHFEAVISVRDDGPGFDLSRVPDPTDSENLEKISGRGLFLIRTFLDDVQFNDRGNEITMVKRREITATTDAQHLNPNAHTNGM